MGGYLLKKYDYIFTIYIILLILSLIIIIFFPNLTSYVIFGNDSLNLTNDDNLSILLNESLDNENINDSLVYDNESIELNDTILLNESLGNDSVVFDNDSLVINNETIEFVNDSLVFDNESIELNDSLVYDNESINDSFGLDNESIGLNDSLVLDNESIDFENDSLELDDLFDINILCTPGYPIYSNYDGSTTNFSALNETEKQNVTNLTLEIENLGKIVWNNNVNASSADFN
jgi:hypothetical protein